MIIGQYGEKRIKNHEEPTRGFQDIGRREFW